ncbi:hypothetical protein JL720_5499 [Aureococcus anophagefferens]|nr:hypothetical protein JL720_5499 [Aureococcus anophagefferens]
MCHGRLARPDRGGFSPEDAAKFGEALLDCDRDCGAALRRLRKTPRGGLRGEVNAFARASVGDVLDLYYGDFKPSGGYGAWKARLKGRRDEAARHEAAGRQRRAAVAPPGRRGRAAAADQRRRRPPGSSTSTTPGSSRRSPATRTGARRSSRRSAAAGGARRRRPAAAAPPAPATPPPPGAAPAARLADATEEAKRVIGLSRYDPRAPRLRLPLRLRRARRQPGPRGVAPAQVGDAVLPRARRAVRGPRRRLLALPPNSAEGARAFARSAVAGAARRDSSSDAEPADRVRLPLRLRPDDRQRGPERRPPPQVGLGGVPPARARGAAHGAAPPSPAAPAPAPATSAAPPPALSPPASPPAAPAARRFLVHAGVLVARHRRRRHARRRRRRPRAAAPRRDTGAVVRAWTVRFDAPGGATRAVDLGAPSRTSLQRARRAAAPAAGDGDHRRFRGVTCKWYADTPRYNAAFSLLGDRFSLGGFDTAAQAARCWDLRRATAGG